MINSNSNSNINYLYLARPEVLLGLSQPITEQLEGSIRSRGPVGLPFLVWLATPRGSFCLTKDAALRKQAPPPIRFLGI